MILAAATVVLACLAVAPPPVAAADAPHLTVSATQAAVGDPLTVTLTGCTGAPPVIGRVWLYGGYQPGGALGLLDSVEAAPGVWQTAAVAADPSDNIFVGRCADGSESTPVRVDVEWPEMFTDPFAESSGLPLDAIVGSDCDPPAVVSVHFRVGERTWVVHPTVDARGDWRTAPPVIPRGRRIGIVGRCGDRRYIPIEWRNDGPKPPLPSNFVLSPGEGRPGTALTGQLVCFERPEVLRSTAGDDTVVPLEAVRVGSSPFWEFQDRAGGADARYSVRCAFESDHIAFDVITNSMQFGPVGRVADGGDPTLVEGTDCDRGRLVRVEMLVGFRPAVVVTPTTDEFGDWSVPLPDGAQTLGVIVNASCGDDFVYETLDRNEEQWRTTTTTTPVEPAAARPAVAQPGTPAFAG